MAEYVPIFTKEYVTEVLGKDIELEEKVALLSQQHEADVRGLKSKNTELLSKLDSSKKDKETIEQKIAEYENQVKDLEEEIKKKADDNSKEYFEAQLAKIEKESAENLAKVESERDMYKTSHLTRLKNDAIAKGLSGLHFVDDSLKEAFVALVLSRNEFVADTIDGEQVFLNKEHKPIEDVMKEMALSDIGKSFIANGNGGGGGSGSNKPNSTKENPFKTGSLAEQSKLYRENPELAKKLAAEAGVKL